MTRLYAGAICKGFLEAYFNMTCDHDPTCQRYRMPADIKRMDLYNLYQTVHKEERLEQSQFYQIMSSNFPHVSFSKSQKCTKCTDCSNFKQLIDKEKDLEKRKELMAIRDLHLQQQQNERESYYVRRAQAEMRPHHVLSLIIDGMDQRKIDLPHYKAWNNPNVWLSFHIVGHTHADIDQAFSKISHKLNEESVITRSSLLDVVKRSHKDQNSIALNLDAVWNISEWLGDCICQVHIVTFPHLYRIFSDQTEHVTVQFKEFSTDVTWRPAWDETPLEIFKLDERSQQIIPEGLPPIVEPKVDQDDWLEVKRSMEKDFKLAVVSELDEVEWREFLENPFQKSEEPVFPLHLLQIYQEVESYFTLSEKEKSLIMNYKKRAQAKQVYTTQQVSGRHRAERADRRRYDVGRHVVYLADATIIQIGQVMEVAPAEITIRLYSTNQFKVSLTSYKQLTTSVSNILPGQFELSASRKLPTDIKRLIEKRSFTLK